MANKDRHDTYRDILVNVWDQHFPHMPRVEVRHVMGPEDWYWTAFTIDVGPNKAVYIILETMSDRMSLYFEMNHVPEGVVVVPLPQTQEDIKTITLFLNHAYSEYLEKR